MIIIYTFISNVTVYINDLSFYLIFYYQLNLILVYHNMTYV